MSRTFRKKGKRIPEWVSHDEWVVSEEWDYHTGFYRNDEWHKRIWTKRLYKSVPRTGNDLKKKLAKWHSGKESDTPPKWFVREYCNKPYRAKMKQEVRKLMKLADDYDDYNFDPCINHAMWDWW